MQRLNTSRPMVTGTPVCWLSQLAMGPLARSASNRPRPTQTKEQQEGKGVEQAAEPGIHQCFPPVSVAWSGIRVVIP